MAAGRLRAGADAFVAYFRELDGFTVDDVSELEVDGLRAIRVALHADLDTAVRRTASSTCINRPRSAPATRTSSPAPGVTDSLIIVEHRKGTLMFEVLPAPNDLEDQVIGSIRFLDQLPGAP